MTANVLFAAGSNRAFEQFMQGKPGFDHYDSSEAVTPEDCGTCRKNRFSHLKIQHIRNIIKIPQEGRQIIMIKRETYMSRIRPIHRKRPGKSPDRYPPKREVGHAGYD